MFLFLSSKSNWYDLSLSLSLSLSMYLQFMWYSNKVLIVFIVGLLLLFFGIFARC